jgi:hypothetical protein
VTFITIDTFKIEQGWGYAGRQIPKKEAPVILNCVAMRFALRLIMVTMSSRESADVDRFSGNAINCSLCDVIQREQVNMGAGYIGNIAA